MLYIARYKTSEALSREIDIFLNTISESITLPSGSKSYIFEIDMLRRSNPQRTARPICTYILWNIESEKVGFRPRGRLEDGTSLVVRTNSESLCRILKVHINRAILYEEH